MPNFKYGINPEANPEDIDKNYNYTGEQIWNAIEGCLDKDDTGIRKMAGPLELGENSSLIIGKDSKILLNEQLGRFKKELNKYTGELQWIKPAVQYGNEEGSWSYIYQDPISVFATEESVSSEEERTISFSLPENTPELYINYLDIYVKGRYYDMDYEIKIINQDTKEEIFSSSFSSTGVDAYIQIPIILLPLKHYKILINPSNSCYLRRIEYYVGKGELL